MLPARPHRLSLAGFKSPEARDLAARMSAWGLGVQAVLDALPAELQRFQAQIDALNVTAAAVSAHASTHLPGGSDALSTGAPGQGIGGGNSEGTATSFARSDHNHKLRETGGPTDLAIGSVSDGQFLKRSGSSVVGASLFSGTAGGVWLADLPPVSPSSYDDEFTVDGSGAPSGWTEFDTGGLCTPSATEGFLRLQQASDATFQLSGVYKAAPTESEWFAYAHISMSVPWNVAQRVALFVSQNLASSPTTADFRTVGPFTGTGGHGGVSYAPWSAYNSMGAATNFQEYPTWGGCYVGLGYDSTNYSYWFSTDGVGWMRMGTETVAGSFSPVHVGLAVANSSGSTIDAFFDWFRVLTGSGCTSLTRGLVYGRRAS